MYNLAFDTTSSGCSVVLMKDKTKLAVFHQNMDFGQAEVLLPEIHNLLQQNGFTQINKYDVVLRQENGKDVNGLLFFAQ